MNPFLRRTARRLLPAAVVQRIKEYPSRPPHALWEQRHLRRLLPYLQVDCVFDVGANEGQYATFLRKYAGYKNLIISFEPNPEVLEVLLARSERDPNWIVEDIALSDKTGWQTLNIMNAHQFTSLSSPDHDVSGRFQKKNMIKKTFRSKPRLWSWPIAD